MSPSDPYFSARNFLPLSVTEAMQAPPPEEIPGIPVFTLRQQEMIHAILKNAHWGKGSQHGIHMQPAWRVHWQYNKFLRAYISHAMRCFLYEIMGGEPPPGRDGNPPSKLLPEAERRAMTMLTEEGALLSSASSATGIEPEKLKEIYVSIREQILACGMEADARFRQQALHAIENS